MHVAYVLDTFPAVSETFVLDQITAMIERGHEVSIVADAAADHDPIHADVERFRLIDRRRIRPSLSWSTLPRVLGLTGLIAGHGWKRPAICVRSLLAGREGRSGELWRQAVPLLHIDPIDVVHAHHGWNGVRMDALRRLGVMNAPLLTSFHGSDATAYPTRYGNSVYRALFAHGERFTVNSAFTRQNITQLGAPDSRVTTLPVGVRASHENGVPLAARNDDPIRLLSVARLVPVKGIEFAIRAVAALRDRDVPIRYDIIGDGPERASLESLVRELDVQTCVSLHGALPIERVRESYATSHVLLAPGIVTDDGAAEAQGLTLLEAQSHGMLVIASDVGGMPDSVCPEQRQHLVPQQQPSALADMIQTAIASRSHWDEWSHAGRQYVTDHFDHAKLMTTLETIYRELADTGVRSVG
ncbi:MAG: glycosyltransferase [Planctomycetota bacterium]